jgi:hypothetical protein
VPKKSFILAILFLLRLAGSAQSNSPAPPLFELRASAGWGLSSLSPSLLIFGSERQHDSYRASVDIAVYVSKHWSIAAGALWQQYNSLTEFPNGLMVISQETLSGGNRAYISAAHYRETTLLDMAALQVNVSYYLPVFAGIGAYFSAGGLAGVPLNARFTATAASLSSAAVSVDHWSHAGKWQSAAIYALTADFHFRWWYAGRRSFIDAGLYVNYGGMLPRKREASADLFPHDFTGAAAGKSIMDIPGITGAFSPLAYGVNIRFGWILKTFDNCDCAPGSFWNDSKARERERKRHSE